MFDVEEGKDGKVDEAILNNRSERVVTWLWGTALVGVPSRAVYQR